MKIRPDQPNRYELSNTSYTKKTANKRQKIAEYCSTIFSKIQSLKKKISKSLQQGNFLIFVIFLSNYNDEMGIIG